MLELNSSCCDFVYSETSKWRRENKDFSRFVIWKEDSPSFSTEDFKEVIEQSRNIKYLVISSGEIFKCENEKFVLISDKDPFEVFDDERLILVVKTEDGNIFPRKAKEICQMFRCHSLSVLKGHCFLETKEQLDFLVDVEAVNKFQLGTMTSTALNKLRKERERIFFKYPELLERDEVCSSCAVD